MMSAVSRDEAADRVRSASSIVSGYGLAIAAFAAALILTLSIRHVTGNPTFFLFYVAIFVSVWFGGRGAGWITTALAIVTLHSFFRATTDLLVVTGKRHRVEKALRSARDRLETAVQDRTAELRRANANLSIEIAERGRAEAAVRAREERWRRLFETSSAGMALTDLTSRYVATNSAFQNMLGYTDEEFKALSALDITHPDERVITEAIVAEFASGTRQEYHVDKRYMKKDGTPLWVNVTTTYVPATDITPPMLQGVYINIDDHKRAEAAVHASEERWRRLFEASAAGMALTNLTSRYIATNSAFQNMLGYTDEEFKALSALDITHPDERVITKAIVAEFASGARQ